MNDEMIFSCPNCEGTGQYDDCTCTVCEGDGSLTEQQWQGTNYTQHDDWGEPAKPLAEDALVETVAEALWDFEREGTDWPAWGGIKVEHYGIGWKGQIYYRAKARTAIAAVRAHDAGMPCGFCEPNSDEVRCACEIDESHDD